MLVYTSDYTVMGRRGLGDCPFRFTKAHVCSNITMMGKSYQYLALDYLGWWLASEEPTTVCYRRRDIATHEELYEESVAAGTANELELCAADDTIIYTSP